MSESSDKPSRQQARNLCAGTDILTEESEPDLSDQRGLQKSSESKSEAENQNHPDSIYGPKLPPVLAKILGPPPLVGNEDPRLYGEFFRHFAEEYDPQGITDWLYVIDLTQLNWERLRERRLKPEVIKICQEEPDGESHQNITFTISPADARA